MRSYYGRALRKRKRRYTLKTAKSAAYQAVTEDEKELEDRFYR